MDPDMETVKCQAELAAGLVPDKVKSDPGQRAAGLVLEAMRGPDAAGGGLKPGAATGLVPDVGGTNTASGLVPDGVSQHMPARDTPEMPTDGGELAGRGPQKNTEVAVMDDGEQGESVEPVLQELEAASVVASYSLTPMTCEGASPDRAEINPFAAAAHGMPTGLLGGGEDVGRLGGAGPDAVHEIVLEEAR